MAKFYRIIPFTLVLVLFAASIGLLYNKPKKKIDSFIDSFRDYLSYLDKYDVGTLIEFVELGGGKGFDAILKLRERRDERAIPALEKILKEHLGTGDIFGFAAAQALFCIGTPEAHDVLVRYLFTDKYDVELGINYTFHWEMMQSARDSFIRRYHLRSSSNDIKIQLEAGYKIEEDKQKITFSVTLTNISKNELYLYIPGTYTGKLLLFYSEDGYFVRDMQTADHECFIEPVSFTKLGSGKSIFLTTTAIPCWSEMPGSSFFPGLFKDEAFIMDFKDVAHIIEKPGRFKVYAVFSVGKRFADVQEELLDLPPVWSGRVVSEPVEIEILPID